MNDHLDHSPQGCDRRWRTKRQWMSHGAPVNTPRWYRRLACRKVRVR